MASAHQLGFTFKLPDRRIWTVRDLVAAVRTHLEREYTDTWVEREISNFRARDSGHLYFTLKNQNSQIRVEVVSASREAGLSLSRPSSREWLSHATM